MFQNISSKTSFIYILVDTDLNMANAPMHTENDASSWSPSLSQSTIPNFQSYRQHILTHKHMFLCTINTHIWIHVYPGNTEIEANRKPTLTPRNARKTHDKCDCRSLEYVHTTTFTIVQSVKAQKVVGINFITNCT